MNSKREKIEGFLKNMHALKHYLTERHSKNKDKDVSNTQWLVLKAIHHAKKPIGIKEIAQNLGITSSAATQTVNALEQKGYIERKTDLKDRRNIQIQLSEKARKKGPEMREKIIADLLPLFEVFTDEELHLYSKLTQKLAQNITSPPLKNGK